MTREELMQALQNEPLALAQNYFYMLSAALDGEPNAAIRSNTERALARREGAVAVIPITGILAGRASILTNIYERYGFITTTETLTRNIQDAVDDAGVKAIVLDVSSPGGTTFGMAEAADAIFAMRGKKPILAQSNHVMASAAYWLASQADEVIASKSSMVGSIGVYTIHVDRSGFNEALGVTPTYISAGKFKADGNPDQPLSDTARETIQASVDDSYKLFVDAVARGRGVSSNDVRAGYGEGRVLPASMALKSNLVDKVRGISETLAAYGVSLRSDNPGQSAQASFAANRLRAEIDILSQS